MPEYACTYCAHMIPSRQLMWVGGAYHEHCYKLKIALKGNLQGGEQEMKRFRIIWIVYGSSTPSLGSMHDTVESAQKEIENAISTQKVTQYEVYILDTHDKEIATWSSAVPPALKWGKEVVAETAKK